MRSEHRAFRRSKRCLAVLKRHTAASTRVESFASEAERLSLEMARLSSICEDIVHGVGEETMTNGVNAHKQWTWLSEATLVYDSKADPFTADDLFDRIRWRLNVVVIEFTSDGDFLEVPQRCSDGTRQVL